MNSREQVIEFIDQMLSLCDERSLWMVYHFVIHFTGRERAS